MFRVGALRAQQGLLIKCGQGKLLVEVNVMKSMVIAHLLVNRASPNYGFHGTPELVRKVFSHSRGVTVKSTVQASSSSSGSNNTYSVVSSRPKESALAVSTYE